MKKSTLFLLAAAVVLAVVAFLVSSGGGKPAVKKLDIAGYATDAEIAAEKKLGMMDAKPTVKYPIDEIDIEREDGAVKLVKTGDGEQATWRIAAPVDAPAVKYQVEQIIELFKTPTTRMDVRTIKDKDLPLFDLEPSRRIGLTLKANGAVWNGVDLVIGQVVKDTPDGGEETTKGTWVLVKGDETTAFLLADKDLRTPANKALTDLRDKKALDVDADAISSIEVTDPSGERVVLSGVTKETPPAPSPDGTPPAPGTDGAKPTKTTTWTLTEPAGVKGDASISSVAKNLANLRVNEFVPLAKATDEAKKALADKTWKVSLKAGDKTTVITVSDAAKEPIWGRVEGRDEIFSLASYAANNLRKGLDELKDKTVWDVSADAVTDLTLKGDAGPIALTKADGAWKFTAPATATYPADPSSLVTQIDKLQAVRWAKKSELEAARKALATPDITASVKVGTTTYALTIGALEKDAGAGAEGGGAQNRWAVVGDVATGEPFQLSDYNAKRFATTVDALRQKKLLPKGKDDIAAVTIQLAGGKDAVTLEKPSTGGDLTIATPPAGKVANDETIKTIVATLGALEAKSFFEGKDVATTGLDPAKANKIVIKSADGTSATLLISVTSAGEGAVYAVIDQGPLAGVPVGLNEYQAKNLEKPLTELVKDAELPGKPPSEPPTEPPGAP